jgi:hypothetical protein
MEPTGKMKVTASVHCECTIALHMVEKFRDQRKRPKFMEIGISKYSCWLCEMYLELLVQSESGFIADMKLAVSGYQGKIQAGWRIPPNGPFNVTCRMGALLGCEMDAILENAEREHSSDSFPRYSSTGDDDVDIVDSVDSETGPGQLWNRPGI